MKDSDINISFSILPDTLAILTALQNPSIAWASPWSSIPVPVTSYALSLI